MALGASWSSNGGLFFLCCGSSKFVFQFMGDPLEVRNGAATALDKDHLAGRRPAGHIFARCVRGMFLDAQDKFASSSPMACRALVSDGGKAKRSRHEIDDMSRGGSDGSEDDPFSSSTVSSYTA